MSSANKKTPVIERKSGRFSRILYIARIFTYLCAMPAQLMVAWQRSLPLYYWLVIIFVCLIMPHVDELIRIKTQFYKKIDYYLFISPALWVGVMTGMLDFSLYAFAGSAFCAYTAPIIVAGLSNIYKYVLATALGLLVGGLMSGFHYDQSASLSLQLVTMGTLMFYFFILSIGMNLNSNYLKKSRDLLFDTTSTIKTFNQVLEKASTTLSLDSIISSLLTVFGHQYFESIAFLLYDQTNKKLDVAFFDGIYTDKSLVNLIKEIKIPIDITEVNKSYIVSAFTQNKAIYLPQVPDPHGLPSVEYQLYSLASFHGMLIIPITVESKIIGLMVFLAAQKRAQLTPLQVDLLNSYLLRFSVIINNALTHQQLMNDIKLIESETIRFERLHGELSKYLSPQIYERIFFSEEHIELSSQYKFLTICFTDIVGFTELSEYLEPEEMTRMLNYYLNEMTNIAFKYNGVVEKYVGDSIQLFFGDPTTTGREDDALRSCKMALEMQEKVNELQHIWSSFGITKRLLVRIGIHSGFCSVGNFGSDYHMQYSVVGEPVNIANEIQTLCEPGHVLISKSTHELVQAHFEFKEQNDHNETFYEIVREK